MDISRVKGEDLECNDPNYDYILSYSFPCQDLSVAGKRAGMKDNSTRSGLLWEVERILTECKELEKEGKGMMPTCLLLENVIQLHSEQDLPHFIKWINRLEELGYQSYWEDLIGTEIGYPEPVPQTRNRCFMVSLYGDYVYNFPKPKPLKSRLKDLLEKNVDEKYYLSKKQLDDIQGWNAYQKPLEAMEQTDKAGVSPTLTTRSGAYAAGMILVKEELEPKVLGGIGEKDSNGGTQWKQQNRIYDNNVAISVTTGFAPYYKTEEYVGTYDYAQSDTLRPTKESRTHINSDVSGALLASGNHNGIITIPLKRGYDCEVKQEQNETDQIDVIDNYSKSNFVQTSIVGKNGVAPTVTENHGQTTAILEKCRIRKLTPRECFRLQGVKDCDIDKIMKNQSDSSGYHLAGDSIIVNVLAAIFKEML